MSNILNITYIDCDGVSGTTSYTYNGTTGETLSFCFRDYDSIVIENDGLFYPISNMEPYMTLSPCIESPTSGSCGEYVMTLTGGASASVTYTPCGGGSNQTISLNTENTPMIICAEQIITPVAVNVNYTYTGTCDSGNVSGKAPVSRCVLYEIYIKDISPSRPSNDRIITYDDCDGTSVSTTLDYGISRTHFIQGTEDTIIFNSNVYEIRNITPI